MEDDYSIFKIPLREVAPRVQEIDVCAEPVEDTDPQKRVESIDDELAVVRIMIG